MRKSKKIVLSILSALTMAAALVACAKEGDGPQFLEGSQTTFEMTESVMIRDIVDVVEGSEYTITISKGDYSVDVSNKAYWNPSEPGEYTITYTVTKGENKGTSTFNFTVLSPKLSWDYTIPTDMYDVGQTLVFDEYFEEFNSYIESWYGYKYVMDSVTFGEQTIEFTDETSYTFTDSVKHLFKFHVETEDGQRISAQAEIGIRYINEQTQEWLTDHSITTYNELRLNDDGSVVMGVSEHSGSKTQGPTGALKFDMSYVAFNGNYGLNDYLVLDFTGNNMPYIVFFNDEVSNSCWYNSALKEGNKGIVLSNGWTTNKGVPFTTWKTSINNRLQLNGPDKIRFADADRDNTFRKTVTGGANASMTSLLNTPDDQYRLIVGYTGGAADSITVEVYLYNLTTGNVAYSGGRTLENLSETDGVTFADDYFNGNIVLYGQFGLNTKIDRLYPIVENTTMEDVRKAYCKAATFVEDAPQVVELNQQLNVADYINPVAGANYWLKLTDPDGNVTDITGEETFTVSKIGAYTLSYNDGVYATASMKIGVSEIAAEMKTWMQANQVSTYLMQTATADGKITLSASTHNGSQTVSPQWSQIHDMSYVAFNGNYGLNDFLVLDFTGDNLPYISFFNEEVAPSVFYNPYATEAQNKAIVVANGWNSQDGNRITAWDASMNKRYVVYASNKIYFADADKVDGVTKQGRWSIFSGDEHPHVGKLALASSSDSYRLIIGIVNGTAGGMTIKACVLNLTTRRVVANNTLTVSYAFGEDYFTGGSIALYGQHGKQTVIDKLYAIEENVTMEDMIEKYVPTSQFAENAKTAVRSGEVLNVSDYIQTVDGATYTLSYSDGTTETPITGDTFSFAELGTYTLIYNDGVNFTATLQITVQEVDAAFAQWMTDNNVTSYKLEDAKANGKVVLGASTHSGSETAYPQYTQKHDMSYLAYNGEYGVNDFVVLDFTGNNMPYITFFADEVTNSAYYSESATAAQNKGVVVSNGAMWQNGQTASAYDSTYNKRFMVYGPNKIYYTDSTKVNGTWLGWGPQSIFSTGDHIGVKDLSASTDQYRLIIGVTEYTSSKMTISAFVYNLTTKTVVQENSVTVTNVYGADTFSGAIVLHGMIGKATTIDKVYAIEQDTTMSDVVNKYFPVSQFKATASTSVAKGQVLNVSDYIQTVAGATYTLSYIYNDVETPITGDTFSFAEFGKYTLVYNDGVNRTSEMTVMVENMDVAFATWMAQNNVSIYNSVSAMGSAITLAGSTHNSTDNATSMVASGRIHDMSYLAYNGSYGAGDFLVVDFTGDNMPYMNFFAGEVTNSIFYDANKTAAQNKGITVTNGFRAPSTGTMFTDIPANRPQIIGVNKIFKPFDDPTDQAFRSNVLTTVTETGDMMGAGMSILSNSTNSNVKFRMIAGFSATSETSVTFNMVIIKLDTGAVWYNGGRIINNAAFADFDFSGSIVLYSSHGKDLALDKVYAIEENTTVDALITKYTPSVE